MSNGSQVATLGSRLRVPLSAWKNVPKEVRKSIITLFVKVFVSPSSYCEFLSVGRVCDAYDEVRNEEGDAPADALCRKCPLGRMKVSCAFMSKEKKEVSFYRGDEDKVSFVVTLLKKYNKNLAVKDKRVVAPLKKCTKIHKSDDTRSKMQENLANEFVKKGYGILVAAARFGKTRTACLVFSKLRQRTFVLAHQVELLEQFQIDWLKFSDLSPSDIKINPSVNEAKELPVSLFTYQHFLQKHGRKRLKALCKVPGLVVVDEAHRAASAEFTKVVNAFRARYRLGITATPNRKDKLSFRIYNTFGPVTATGGVESLACKYKVIPTNVIFSSYDKVAHNRRFSLLQKAMARQEDRNDLIARRVVKNVEKGHKVIVPLKTVEHVKTIASLVRAKMKAAKFTKVKVCEYSASVLKGKSKRQEVSQQIRDGYYDVVVAVESMLNVGFNAPLMSCIVLNAGTYSFNNENRYQLFSRIRTRHKGKKTPLIDIIHDDCKWSNYSLKAIRKQMEEFGFKEIIPKNKEESNASTKPRGRVINLE